MERFSQHATPGSTLPLWYGGPGVYAPTLADARQTHLAATWPLIARVEPVIVQAVTSALADPASNALFDYRFAHVWAQEREALRDRLLGALASPVDSPDQKFSVQVQIDILLAGMLGMGIQQDLFDAYAARVAWLEAQPGFGSDRLDRVTGDPGLVNLVEQIEGQANYARYQIDAELSTRGIPPLPNRLAWDQSPGSVQETVIATTPDRVELARKTHRSVVIKLGIIMAILAAVILTAGIYLSGRGEASLSGILIIAGAFLAMIWVYWWVNRREVAKAERFLAADGATQFRITDQALTVGDTAFPFAQITGIFFNLELEIYSSGGITGQAMSRRLHMSEDNIMGTAVGVRAGTKLRRQLYQDGAKSWAWMTLGVEDRDTIAPSSFAINPMRSLPKSSLGRGRIDIPVGAYLTRDDLVVLFEALEPRAASYNFPMGVVSGVINWAQAQTMLSRSRDEIWDEAKTVINRD